MIKCLALAFLLIASPAWGAITSVGTLGNANATTSGNTLAITTSADLETGNTAIVFTAFNNTGTTDTDHSEVQTVVDEDGNVGSKLCEFTNGQGAANAGATISVWKVPAAVTLESGKTITITYTNTITSRAAVAWEFTSTAALMLAGACQTEAVDGGQAGSMTVSGLTSAEYLFIRAIALESNPGGGLTVTSGYSSMGNALADGGSVATSEKAFGEFIIATVTGHTSDPATPTSADQASVFFALQEAAAPAARRPVAPMIFQ